MKIIIIIIMKKKGAERIWATAQLYCEKKKKLYCNLGFVLQEEGWLQERESQYKNCIVTRSSRLTRFVLQRRSLEGGVVSQYTYCIVTAAA